MAGLYASNHHTPGHEGAHGRGQNSPPRKQVGHRQGPAAGKTGLEGRRGGRPDSLVTSGPSSRHATGAGTARNTPPARWEGEGPSGPLGEGPGTAVARGRPGDGGLRGMPPARQRSPGEREGPRGSHVGPTEGGMSQAPSRAVSQHLTALRDSHGGGGGARQVSGWQVLAGAIAPGGFSTTCLEGTSLPPPPPLPAS